MEDWQRHYTATGLLLQWKPPLQKFIKLSNSFMNLALKAFHLVRILEKVEQFVRTEGLLPNRAVDWTNIDSVLA